MSKKSNDLLRANYIEVISKALSDLGEEVLRVGTGEIAIPVVDSEGEDNYVVFTVKIPSGSRDGEAYDGYGEAESYKMKCKDKAEKKAKSDADKAAKVERDRKLRESKARAKAERA